MSPLFREDPLINLNYSLLLFNSGDKAAAAKQFLLYQSKMRKLDVKQLDMDPEVSTTSILDFQLMLPVLSHASKVAHYCVFYPRHKWLLS